MAQLGLAWLSYLTIWTLTGVFSPNEASFCSNPFETFLGAYRCEGTECGDNDSGERYDGVCDKDGCDFASYRYGDQKYWGKGSGFTINTETKKITVVTQFITHDGTDNGDLVEVRRFYRANGQEFQNSKATFDSIAGMDSITDEFCQKGIFL